MSELRRVVTSLVAVDSKCEIEEGECFGAIMRIKGGSKSVRWPDPMSCVAASKLGEPVFGSVWEAFAAVTKAQRHRRAG
jgi:hypothetical protein